PPRCDPGGKLSALLHEAWEVTSRADAYKVAGTHATARLYACPNVWTKVNLVRAGSCVRHRRHPTSMLSNARWMSSLSSWALIPSSGGASMIPRGIRVLPYTSRSLMQCFDEAAAAFGWARRDPRAGSMRDSDWLVGWGCAMATYPSQVAPASARPGDAAVS